MSEYRKILMTTDLSEESWQAFETASEMATRFDAALCALCVILDPNTFAMFGPHSGHISGGLDEYREQTMRHSRESIEQRLAQAAPAVTPSVVAVLGDSAPEAILGAAKKEGVDLLVMATHGRSGLSHWLLGSTTERVVRLSDIPVLTVRVKDED